METQMETQSIPALTPSSALVLDDSAAAAGPGDESAAPVHGDGDDDSDGSRGEARDELLKSTARVTVQHRWRHDDEIAARDREFIFFESAA
jgi:hypothetical protein